MKRVKAWAVVAFYLAAVAGFIDMAAQATSHGCARPIHATLEFVTGMKSAPPPHCVVPVVIEIQEGK